MTGTDSAAPPWLHDPVQHLVDLCGARPATRHIVGLAGFPGAGKSTLAKALAARANARMQCDAVLALGMDGFHLTRAQLAVFPDPQAALARRGAPWTFDPQALAERLRLLRDMGVPDAPAAPASALAPAPALRWPAYAHGVGDPQPDAIEVPATVRLVLLEGLYLLHRDHGWDLAHELDECWFLATPLERAMQRLARRHMASWGMDIGQAMRRIDANDRLNAQFVLAGRDRADWLIADVPLDAPD